MELLLKCSFWFCRFGRHDFQNGRARGSTNFLFQKVMIKQDKVGDFPGGPVVKNLPSNAGDGVRSLVGELGSHMPRDS